MLEDPRFGLSPYHVTLVVIGLGVILSRWLPRLVSSREPASAPLMIGFGACASLLMPDIALLPDPRTDPHSWELLSELTVIIALFGAGMRIDKLRPWRRWIPTARLLLIAMPITIASVAFLGATFSGLSIAGAVLLGAVLAPTDPVLAGDVQVGPPQEGDGHPVRYTLTTEAALNDGLAFPFVYLGLTIAAQGLAFQSWGLEWFAWDVVYRIVVGAAVGWGMARVIGYILFATPHETAMAETASGVIALAGILLCYGATELVEGYGFIGVAFLGLTLRRVEEDHAFHLRLHDFSIALEHAFTALLLIALGLALPTLFQSLTWTHVGIALAVILVIRPLSGWIGLSGCVAERGDRAVMAIYGVRGIGSIYYLAYAAGHIEFPEEAQLWSLVGLVILLSTILHGFTVGPVMDRIQNRAGSD